ncbi:MAG: toll/interleukin-1 receptor domain-containing protein [Christensenellales bacterium]|jgi:hypothetical protein|nr:toll/interleukin-1 receptor domain-containing protein [Clostridiales bacterium]
MNKKIFISYTNDKYAVVPKLLRGDLEKSGYEVFKEENIIGENWENQIAAAIENANWFIVFMTKQSMRRPDGCCLEELLFARTRKKKIIPIMLESVEIPLFIASLQYFDASDIFCSDGTVNKSKYEAMLNIIRESLIEDEKNYKEKMRKQEVLSSLILYLKPLLDYESPSNEVDLETFYYVEMHKIFKNQEENEADKIKSFLEVILAAQEPFSIEEVANILTVKKEEVENLYNKVKDLFPIKNKKITILHESLYDWLVERNKSGIYSISLTNGHKTISDYYKRIFERRVFKEEYLIKHLAKHAIGARDFEYAADILMCKENFDKREDLMGLDLALRTYLSDLLNLKEKDEKNDKMGYVEDVMKSDFFAENIIGRCKNIFYSDFPRAENAYTTTFDQLYECGFSEVVEEIKEKSNVLMLFCAYYWPKESLLRRIVKENINDRWLDLVFGEYLNSEEDFLFKVYNFDKLFLGVIGSNKAGILMPTRSDTSSCLIEDALVLAEKDHERILNNEVKTLSLILIANYSIYLAEKAMWDLDYEKGKKYFKKAKKIYEDDSLLSKTKERLEKTITTKAMNEKNKYMTNPFKFFLKMLETGWLHVSKYIVYIFEGKANKALEGREKMLQVYRDCDIPGGATDIQYQIEFVKAFAYFCKGLKKDCIKVCEENIDNGYDSSLWETEFVEYDKDGKFNPNLRYIEDPQKREALKIDVLKSRPEMLRIQILKNVCLEKETYKYGDIEIDDWCKKVENAIKETKRKYENNEF